MHTSQRNEGGWLWTVLGASVVVAATLWAVAPHGASVLQTPPPASQAVPRAPVSLAPEPWYVLKKEHCLLAQGEDDPRQRIKDMAIFGASVFMRDVTEHGTVVETTMVTRNALLLAGWGVSELELWRWFRGEKRCEQARLRQAQRQAQESQAQQEALERRLAPYR